MLSAYLQVHRGYLNYFKNCDNFFRFRNRINYILRYSFLLTLNKKYKLKSVKKTIDRFGTHLGVETPHKKSGTFVSKTANILQIPGPLKKDGTASIRYYPAHDEIIKSETRAPIPPQDIIENLFYRAKRTKDWLGQECSKCKSISEIRMHHVNPVKNIPKHYSPLKKTEMARARYQIALCKSCHDNLHAEQTVTKQKQKQALLRKTKDESNSKQ
jgi:hypothetical protein